MTIPSESQTFEYYDPVTNPIPIPDEPSHAAGFCVPVGKRWLIRITDAIERLAWPDVWQGTSDQQMAAASDIIYVMNALITALPCDVEIKQSIVSNVVYNVLIEQEGDSLQLHRYEKKNGVWYLVIPCGDCGGWEYVPLGAASSTDANGNPAAISANAPALLGYEISIPEVTGDAATACYPERATNYLLERFRQFLNAAAGTVAQVLDARFVVADEVIDYVRILLPDVDQSNIIDAIRTEGEQGIFNAVLGYQDALRNNWTYSHNLTKDALKQWVKDSTPVISIAQQALLAWIDASLLYGISKDLRLIAADCQAGTNFLEGATESGIVPFETNIDGVGPFYMYKFNVVGSTYVTADLMEYPPSKRLLAIALYHDGHEGNGLGTYAVQFPLGTFWQFRALTAAAGNRLTIYSDSLYADIWAQFEAGTPDYGAVGNPPYGLDDPAPGDILTWNNNGLAENWLTAPRLYMIFDDAP